MLIFFCKPAKMTVWDLCLKDALTHWSSLKCLNPGHCSSLASTGTWQQSKCWQTHGMKTYPFTALAVLRSVIQACSHTS